MSESIEDDWEYEQFVDHFDPMNDCSRCQGSGEVPTADFESYFGENYKPCPECQGTKTKGNRCDEPLPTHQP